MTVSELTREAIAAHLDVPGSGTDDASVRLRRRLSSTGSGASGRANISERIEELLRQDFGRADLGRDDRIERALQRPLDDMSDSPA